MTTAQRITAVLAVTASLAAVATPALARPFNLNANGSYVVVPPAPAVSAGLTSQPAIIRLTVHNGFAWADAGIGAASAIALLAILIGGTLSASHYRRRRPTSPRS